MPMAIWVKKENSKAVRLGGPLPVYVSKSTAYRERRFRTGKSLRHFVPFCIWAYLANAMGKGKLWNFGIHGTDPASIPR